MQLRYLSTKLVGKNLIYFEEIDSTQMFAKNHLNNLVDGTVIIADIQTNGCGTHGRKWYTKESGNIAFSIVLKPNVEISRLDRITLDIAGIVSRVFKILYNIELSIKIPNDIYYNDKKICGILVETKILDNKVVEMIIGIGINTIEKNFEEEIKKTATSIKKEFGINVDNEIVISMICNLIEKEILERLGT